MNWIFIKSKEEIPRDSEILVKINGNFQIIKYCEWTKMFCMSNWPIIEQIKYYCYIVEPKLKENEKNGL